MYRNSSVYIVANMCDYQKYVFMRAYVKYTFQCFCGGCKFINVQTINNDMAKPPSCPDGQAHHLTFAAKVVFLVSKFVATERSNENVRSSRDIFGELSSGSREIWEGKLPNRP